MMAVWAVYDVLAGVLVGNIAFYELLRKLVSPRKNEGGMVCCGRGLLLWLAPLIFSSGPAVQSTQLSPQEIILPTFYLLDTSLCSSS